MTYETILYSKSEGVATITLNRPKVLNALSTTLFRELDTAITEVESDEEVKAVIITGAGDRAFTAGADIHEMTRNAESDSPPPADPKRPT